MGKKIVILGAGISGLSTGYHLKLKGIDSLVLEKNESYGGLCDNFTIGGFRFDKFVHFSFTKNKYVMDLFKQSTDYYEHPPLSSNYYRGIWLKHPVQNNLYPLPTNEKVKIIMDFINSPKYEKIKNYEEWLRASYGVYFSKNFPEVYTRKYWTVEAKKMNTDWISNRMYRPSLEEILYGAMSQETPNVYYASEMRYPKKGGYKSFLSFIRRFNNIEFNKEVVKIDLKNKIIFLSNGTTEKYDILVSSIPLPEIVKMSLNVPKEILQASQKLSFTSGALVSLGLKKLDQLKTYGFIFMTKTFFQHEYIFHT